MLTFVFPIMKSIEDIEDIGKIPFSVGRSIKGIPLSFFWPDIFW